MEININSLYNKEIAESISLLEEFIIDINNELAERNVYTKWQKIGDIDGYYFSIVNPSNKKQEISFGIWNELWVKTACPLALIFEFNNNSNLFIFDTLNTFLKDNNLNNLKVYEFEESVSLLFYEEYLLETKYIQDLVNLIIELTLLFDFKIDVIKKKW